jgi:hypothetical protein
MAIFRVHPEICQTCRLNAKDKEELKLVNIGRYGETMDDIIKKCIKVY